MIERLEQNLAKWAQAVSVRCLQRSYQRDALLARACRGLCRSLPRGRGTRRLSGYQSQVRGSAWQAQ